MADDNKNDDAQQTTSDKDGTGDSQEKTLTQTEVDRIVQERVAREKARYSDYDDLKAKVAASESDQERAVREAAEKARDEALSEVGAARLEDRIQVAAAKVLNDPADAVRLLDRDGLDPFDSKVDAEIGKRVKALVEAKPYLAAEPPAAGSSDAGSRSTPPSTGGDMNSVIRRAAGRT